MRILTIHQPFASLIASGAKLVENRSWPTRYRGPLLIHAGKSRQWLDRCDERPAGELPFGAVVAVADLVDVVTIEALRAGAPGVTDLRGHRHAFGPLCWVLRNARPLRRPIPWTGAQGLRPVPDGLRRRVLAQL